MEMNMKKLLLSAAFAAALATPAFAQSFDPDFGTGNVNPPMASEQGFGSAYAYAPREAIRVHRQSVRAHRVYQDPNISLQQRRDDLEY
jgi:hypothetical protein